MKSIIAGGLTRKGCYVMTKTEARECMSVELVRCIGNYFEKLPSKIKIDKKGTKNYISFDEYGVYICFYVTSSLAVSYRSILRGSEKNLSLIEYDEARDKKELKSLVLDSFKQILDILN